MDSLVILPDDVLHQIFSQLELFPDICSVGCVSKRLSVFTNSTNYWGDIRVWLGVQKPAEVVPMSFKIGRISDCPHNVLRRDAPCEICDQISRIYSRLISTVLNHHTHLVHTFYLDIQGKPTQDADKHFIQSFFACQWPNLEKLAIIGGSSEYTSSEFRSKSFYFVKKLKENTFPSLKNLNLMNFPLDILPILKVTPNLESLSLARYSFMHPTIETLITGMEKLKILDVSYIDFPISCLEKFTTKLPNLKILLAVGILGRSTSLFGGGFSFSVPQSTYSGFPGGDFVADQLDPNKGCVVIVHPFKANVEMEKFLELVPFITCPDRNIFGWNILHLFCFQDFQERIMCLIEKCGADVNSYSVGTNESKPFKDPWIPLFPVSLLALASPLITGYSLENSSEGYTPLHCCASTKFDSTNIMSYLIEKKANINAQSLNKKMTPLMVACQKCNLSAVRFLIDVRADLALTDRIGWTAFHYALSYTKPRPHGFSFSFGLMNSTTDTEVLASGEIPPKVLEILEVLLSCGTHTYPRAKNGSPSLLSLACYLKSPKLIQYILKSGVMDYYYEGNHDKEPEELTPLHSAIDAVKELVMEREKSHELEVVKLLLEASPDLLKDKDKNGNTPLLLACSQNKPAAFFFYWISLLSAVFFIKYYKIHYIFVKIFFFLIL